MNFKSIQYRKVAEQTDLPAVIRLLARDLIENSSYFVVGKWLKDLSRPDLDLLIDMTEEMNSNSNAAMPIVLLAEMLASAEGVEILDAEGAQKRLGYLATILLMESLYRKGAIELDHNRMSFGDDEMNAEIARPKRKDDK